MTALAPTQALKRCSRCSELVQRDARACRYCGHSFDRSHRPPWWFAVGVLVIIAVVATLVGFHGIPGHGHTQHQDLPALEADIQAHLGAQLRRTSGNPTIRVRAVHCIAQAKNAATCIADLTDRSSMRVVADFDGSTGTYIWHTATP